MGILGGLVLFLLLAGLTAALVTLGMGLWTLPGQCSKVCKACDCAGSSSNSGSATDDKNKPANTTTMYYPMF